MAHPDGTPLRALEEAVPEPLLAFLLSLEGAQTTEGVWQAILAFGKGFGLTAVDYVYASDYRNWERAQFIRTTFDSRWFDYVRQFPHIRQTSNFRTHAVHFLTPIKTGAAYLDLVPDVSEERRRHSRFTAEMGMEAGIAIPLRMGDPGQAGTIVLGGRFSREAFDALWQENGWAIHAGMLTAHARYTELFKTEFVDRNQLTEKHKELIALVGKGYMDKQIAFELGISFSAVRQRLIAVQEKIGVQNRADLAAVAARIGLVPDPLLKTHDDVLTVFLCTGDGKTGEERPSQENPASGADR